MCDCIDKLNAQLKEGGHNMVISQSFGIHGTIPNAKVLTEKRDLAVKKKPIHVFATFCPFCGEKYPDLK